MSVFFLQVYARMAAKDRTSFRTMAESEDIRNYIDLLGFTPLTSHTAISKEVDEFAQEVKRKIIEEIKSKLGNGERFSVTTDEWTSLKICRYCCVNVHMTDGDHMAIGMVRVTGTLDSEACAELLDTKLKAFGLNMKTDVVATTTDGASVMKKAGTIIPCDHQLCHAHGLHLAVQGIMYEGSMIFIKANYSIDLDNQNYE